MFGVDGCLQPKLTGANLLLKDPLFRTTPQTQSIQLKAKPHGFPWDAMAGVCLQCLMHSSCPLESNRATASVGVGMPGWTLTSLKTGGTCLGICQAPNSTSSCAFASLAILLELSNILHGQRPKKHPRLSTLERKLVVPTLAQIPFVKMPTKWAFGQAQ